MSQNKGPSNRAQYREVAESDTDSPMPSRQGSADHQVVDFGDDTNTLIGRKSTQDEEKYSFNHATYPPPPPQVRSTDYTAAAGTNSGAGTSTGTPSAGMSGSSTPQRPARHRWHSSDLLSGLKHFEHAFEEFDTRKASAEHLTFAQGDMPNTKVKPHGSCVWDVVLRRKIVCEIIQLLAQRLHRHSMDIVHCTRRCYTMDTRFKCLATGTTCRCVLTFPHRNTKSHKIPQCHGIVYYTTQQRDPT
jgi:hypothetical protein